MRRRTRPTVLTPHDGEYSLLTGSPPVADRFVAARRLAIDTGCVVLLKGPATVVADPDGRVLVVTAGDERLATAGTGDVLAGIIGALETIGPSIFIGHSAGGTLGGKLANERPELFKGMIGIEPAGAWFDCGTHGELLRADVHALRARKFELDSRMRFVGRSTTPIRPEDLARFRAAATAR